MSKQAANQIWVALFQAILNFLHDNFTHPSHTPNCDPCIKRTIRKTRSANRANRRKG